RYVLNGVLFSFKDNKLTLVATDGRRLAMLDIELEFPRSHEADIIVPTKAVTELQRLLTDDGEVKVSMGSGQIAFDLNKTLLLSTKVVIFPSLLIRSFLWRPCATSRRTKFFSISLTK